MVNQSNTYYDPEKMRKSWLWIFVIGIISLLIFFIILSIFISKNNKKDNLYKKIIDKTNDYFAINSEEKPIYLGECKNFDITDIFGTETLDKRFKNCNSGIVKVCRISSDEYQYVPILECNDEVTTFRDWTPGDITEITKGNSDIMFKYIPEILKKGEKLYYPDNINDSSKVMEYYASSPTPTYKYIDFPTIAYKWYKEDIEKEYYNNGEYLSEAPEDYKNKSDEKIINYGSLNLLETKNYRSMKEGKIYSVEYVSYPYKYDCIDDKIKGTISSPDVCELRNDTKFKTTKKIYYTCDGSTSVESGVLCSERSKWSSSSCYNEKQTKKGTTKEGYEYTRQVTTGYTCISTSGYIVSDIAWKWYKDVMNKKYYPNNLSLEEENTYYVKNPSSGLSKDLSTKRYVYKYYKFEENPNLNEVWVSISDNSLTLDELFDKFRNLGYNINSLADVYEENNIRYQVELFYRDRK